MFRRYREHTDIAECTQPQTSRKCQISKVSRFVLLLLFPNSFGHIHLLGLEWDSVSAQQFHGQLFRLIVPCCSAKREQHKSSGIVPTKWLVSTRDLL